MVEAVRKRPGMYVGDVHDGSGRDYVLWEVLSNSVDQALAEHTSRVEMIFHADDSVTIADEGLGIAPDTLERALTVMHNTPTFDGHRWHAHLNGFGGMGLAPVNALCHTFEVDTVREGTRHRWKFVRGVAQGPIESTPAKGAVGTRIRFRLDDGIFDDIRFPRERVHTRIAEITAMLPTLTVNVRDEGCSYAAPNGLVDLLRRRQPGARPIVHADEVVDGTRVAIAMTWTGYDQEPVIVSFVNFGETRSGGTHVAGLRQAIRSFAKGSRAKDQIERGLIAYLSVLHRSVEYGEPTRDRLVTREVAPIVRAVAKRALASYFAEHSEKP